MDQAYPGKGGCCTHIYAAQQTFHTRCSENASKYFQIVAATICYVLKPSAPCSQSNPVTSRQTKKNAGIPRAMASCMKRQLGNLSQNLSPHCCGPFANITLFYQSGHVTCANGHGMGVVGFRALGALRSMKPRTFTKPHEVKPYWLVPEWPRWLCRV